MPQTSNTIFQNHVSYLQPIAFTTRAIAAQSAFHMEQSQPDGKNSFPCSCDEKQRKQPWELLLEPKRFDGKRCVNSFFCVCVAGGGDPARGCHKMFILLFFVQNLPFQNALIWTERRDEHLHQAGATLWKLLLNLVTKTTKTSLDHFSSSVYSFVCERRIQTKENSDGLGKYKLFWVVHPGAHEHASHGERLLRSFGQTVCGGWWCMNMIGVQFHCWGSFSLFLRVHFCFGYNVGECTRIAKI